MESGLGMMQHTVDKTFEEELPYIDNIVIGDNSSGKTLLLKLFIDFVRNVESFQS